VRNHEIRAEPSKSAVHICRACSQPADDAIVLTAILTALAWLRAESVVTYTVGFGAAGPVMHAPI